jgi:ABC-type transporter Mla MlaB component
MTGAQLKERAVVSGPVSEQVPRWVGDEDPVHLRVTPEDVRTLHRRIPELVGQVRQQLRSSSGSTQRHIVLDLSAVPPTPIAAPLLFLVHLLRRLVNDKGKIDVIGVTPALRAALIAYDLPDNITVIDAHGRRWPG